MTSLKPSLVNVARGMKTELAERPPVGAMGSGDARCPLQVMVLLERPDPAPWSVRQVTRLAQRIRAELLITAVFPHQGSLDHVDRANLRSVREGVREVTSSLVEQGVRATGEVRLAPYGDQALVASDRADHLDADLVIVLARHGSWFGMFPGSSVAHHLMRKHRRPVLVIPDHERRRSWLSILGGPVRPDLRRC